MDQGTDVLRLRSRGPSYRLINRPRTNPLETEPSNRTRTFLLRRTEGSRSLCETNSIYDSAQFLLVHPRRVKAMTRSRAVLEREEVGSTRRRLKRRPTWSRARSHRSEWEPAIPVGRVPS